MKRAGVVLLFIVLALAYLSPGPGAMLDGRTDTVMSDGTDATTLPYQYSLLIDAWHRTPLSIFYGAVAAPNLNAPEGFALWMGYAERVIVVMLSPFLPVEQLSTALVVVLLLFNALAMYALARRLSWSQSLSIALSIAFAFTAYTRARARVHMAMAGIYHLPLVFLGLVLVAKGKTWRSAAAASACFLASMTVVHYHIITTAFLTPFLVAFLLATVESKQEWPRTILRVAAAAMPAVLFIGFCYMKPVPADFIKPGTTVMPATGDAKPGELHPFMTTFAARPVDYWTGDIGLGDRDWNPIRGTLTSSVSSNLDGSNRHERANGVRWAIWALALAGLLAAFHPATKALWSAPSRRQLLVIAAFTAFSFWLSLSPDVPFARAGPSLWLHSLVSQIRVPSRAGVCVSFGLVMMAGLFLHQVFSVPLPAAPATKKKERAPRWPLATSLRWLAAPAVLPLIMIADLPPFVQEMPMAPIKPAYTELQGQGTGAGLYFPYVSGNYQLREDYDFLQRMRGTRLQILNTVSPNARNDWFLSKMPLQADVVSAINANDPAAVNILTRLKTCVPLTWVVFDAQINAPARQNLCAALGWKLSENGVCRAENLSAPIVTNPEKCF